MATAVLDPSAQTGIKTGYFAWSAEEDRPFIITASGAIPVYGPRVATSLDDAQISRMGSDYFAVSGTQLYISEPGSPATTGDNAYEGLLYGRFVGSTGETYLDTAGGNIVIYSLASYFEAMSTAASVALIGKLNRRYVALQAAGLWTLLDWISWFDVETEQQSMLNAKNPAATMSKVNSPTFSAGNGWTGVAGTTSYLNSGWDAGTDGVNFTQDSAFMAVWCATNVADTNGPLGATKHSVNPRNGAGLLSARANTTSTSTVAAPGATSVGVSSWDRTGASAWKSYRNGAVATTPNTASEARSSYDFYICAYNNAGTPNVSGVQVKGVAWGASLGGDAGQAAFYTAFTAA